MTHNHDDLAPTIQIGWQVFRRIDTISGTSTRMRGVSLVRYESHCADCGVLFQDLVTWFRWKKRVLVRRCVPHRAGGGRHRIDNLAPPIPISALPAWAQPKTDEKTLKASLGRRDPNCDVLSPNSKLRIIEPAEMVCLLDARRATRAAAVARAHDRRSRLAKGAAPAGGNSDDGRPSYLD